MIVYPTENYDSYIDSDDADTYFENRLYADDWVNVSADMRKKALITAFHSINELNLNMVYEDTVNGDYTLSSTYYTTVQADKILTDLQRAQCEQALHELTNHVGEVKASRVSLGGMLSVSFDTKEQVDPPQYSDKALSILRSYIQAKTIKRTR